MPAFAIPTGVGKHGMSRSPFAVETVVSYFHVAAGWQRVDNDDANARVVCIRSSHRCLALGGTPVSLSRALTTGLERPATWWNDVG